MILLYQRHLAGQQKRYAMPDEQPRVSEKFRVFLDGEEIVSGGELTITDALRDGMLCALDGKLVKLLAVVYDQSSGEIDEIHVEEVRE